MEVEYVAEFRFAKRMKAFSLAVGLVLAVSGFFMISGSNLFLVVIFLGGGGIMAYYGYKELRDREAKLKIAKEGLWTKELGFQPWDSIKRLCINTRIMANSSTTHLEIYLKASGYRNPDHSLLIQDLEKDERIKPMIEEFSGIIVEEVTT